MKAGLKTRKRLGAVGFYVAAILLSALECFPFIYMILCSFQPSDNIIFSIPPTIFPTTWRFENYAEAVKQMEFFKALGNTCLMVVTSLTINVIATVLIAYGFARFESKGKNALFTLLLSTMMLPWVVTMVPAFVEYKFLNLLNTRWPLILPAIGGSAYYVFMIRQFIMGIPKDLDEAAAIDGCGALRTLFLILLPNMKPVLATMITFSFVGTWSDYLGPSIYLTNPDHYTLALALKSLKNEYNVVEWKLTMAGSVLYTLPMLAIFLAAQKYFVEGLVVSSFK